MLNEANVPNIFPDVINGKSVTISVISSKILEFRLFFLINDLKILNNK